MKEVGLPEGLPAGYCIIRAGEARITVMEEYADRFSSFQLPETAKGHSRGRRSGRGCLTPIALAADDSERALIRRCIRGGILGRFLKEAYLNIGRPRPLKELLVSEYARTSNIPTPKVVAAVVERANPLWYRGALVTREVSPGVDLQEEALAFDPHDLEAVRSKRRRIDSLGRLIGRMHAAGIYHADLHLKNILKSGEKLYLLDLDAARICRPLPERRKLMNLLRLYRSAQKINRRRPVITRADLLRFARAYSAESNISQENLLRDFREMLPLWRLKWRLSDVLKL